MTYADLLPLFKERLIELLDNTTLDTYRVRYHNVRTILNELKGLIEGWKKNSIKRYETIESCIKETVGLINNDTAIEYRYPIKNKDQVIQILEEYNRDIKGKERRCTIAKSDDVIYLISKIIAETRISYIDNLWVQIGEILTTEGELEDDKYIPEAMRMELLTASLVRELLNLGYSKQFLFRSALDFNEQPNEVEEYLKFEQKLKNAQEKTFRVFLSVYLQNAGKEEVYTNFKSSLEAERILQNEFVLTKSHFVKFLRSSTYKKFYIFECRAMDPNSAIYKAKHELYEELDNLQLGSSGLEVKIHDKAIAVLYQTPKNIFYYQNTKCVLDGHNDGCALLSNKFRVGLNNIKVSNKIETDVKLRLQSAIRHFRIGNQEQELEQKFINYWIGLEFVFSSPLVEENTFQRLKNHLVNILSACYVERNLRYVEEDLVKSRMLLNKDLLSEEKIDELCKNNITSLQKYRLKSIKSCVYNSRDKRKQYVNRHREHLNMHLIRIYHFRNMLIHEAAINQDIEGITSNLRYYLYFVIEQMILFYTTTKMDKLLSIDDFFYEYKLIYDFLISCKNIDDYREIALIKNR